MVNVSTRSAEKAGFSFMNYPKELIVKMKEVEFIYDTSIGNVLNGNHEEE